MRQRIFSGIQPTGIPHLGNYLGAVSKWIHLQNKVDVKTLFCIVDWHAITVAHNPRTFSTQLYDCTASLLGAGLCPTKCILYRQSSIVEHSELMWLLSTIVSPSWLKRMTQYKSKGDDASKDNLALFSYPVLMAADILLYNASHVPVGEDQLQHLELARMIATTFNARFSSSSAYFTKPAPLLEEGNVRRVLSLKDASKKMSKSDPVVGSRIGLTDTAEEIAFKIRKAQTDTISGISYDPEHRPAVSNLVGIMSAVTGKSTLDIVTQYEKSNMGPFKQDVSDALIEHITPIRESILRYQNDRAFLNQVLNSGAEQARPIAQNTMQEVRALMGLLP